MTDWTLALKMLRFLIIGGVRTKALKTHFLFSALKNGVNRIGSGHFADNHYLSLPVIMFIVRFYKPNNSAFSLSTATLAAIFRACSRSTSSRDLLVVTK
jgi:hypothetical protein